MSAQIRPGGASLPRGATSFSEPPADPGGIAFDRWLKSELSRLYDAAIAEPVPEELRRLLERLPANPPR